VIVNARHRGRMELRTTEFGSSAIPMPGWGQSTYAGVSLGVDRAMGLSAVGSAIRLISQLIAAMDLCVFTGMGADKRMAETSWQDMLLDDPNPDQTQFDLLSDISTGLETVGNSLVLKVKGLVKTEVVALVPLDMDYARIDRDPRTQEKRIEVTIDGRTYRYSTSEVLHFRGWTKAGKVAGLSPIALHRQALGNAVAIEEFEGRYFSNNASPGGAIKIPGGVKRARALEMIDVWRATHGGLANAHTPAVLSNGAEWQQIGVNLVDAQFVEAQRYGVEQVARIWGIAPEMLGHPMSKPEATEQLGLRLLNFTIMPRLRRIEQVFCCDPDLFGMTRPEYPEFTTDDMLRTDALTKVQVQHTQIQDGTRLVDEIRAEDGMPPLPPVPDDWTQEPGKVPQITPVGGAPNPTADTGDQAAPPSNPVTGVVPVPKKSFALNGDRRDHD
jgi:HK97 family phage portal protein